MAKNDFYILATVQADTSKIQEKLNKFHPEIVAKVKADTSEVQKYLTKQSFTIITKVQADTAKVQETLDKRKFSLKTEVNPDTAKVQERLDKKKFSIKADVKADTKQIQQNIQDKDVHINAKVTGQESVDNLLVSVHAAHEIFSTAIDITQSFVEEVYKLDDAMTEMAKVSSLSGDALEDYADDLAEVGKNVARSRSEMVEASTEFIKAGYNEEDSKQLAEIASLLQNVADEELSAGEASNFIISQMKAFNLEAKDSSMIVDVLNEISNKFAVSSSDISQNLGKASAALATGNTNYSESISLLTAITEVTRSASRAARGNNKQSPEYTAMCTFSIYLNPVIPKALSLKRSLERLASVNVRKC